MDMVTLALAKGYTDSQRLGYSEMGWIAIGYDGDPTGRDTIDGSVLETQGTFVHVSDVVISGGTVEGAGVITPKGSFEILPGFRQSGVTSDGIWLLRGELNGVSLIYALSFGADIAGLLGVKAGTYFSTDTSAYSYFNYINGYLTETIHPIDPKYLVTVIDLDEHGIDFQSLVLAGGGVKTRDNSAIFDSIQRGGNHLFRGSFQDTTLDLPARFYQYTSDGALYAVGFGLMGNLGSGGVQIDLILGVNHVECVITPLGM